MYTHACPRHASRYVPSRRQSASDGRNDEKRFRYAYYIEAEDVPAEARPLGRNHESDDSLIAKICVLDAALMGQASGVAPAMLTQSSIPRARL
jgi:hypothetical protein